jgi:hypothetical protein
MVLQAQR